MISYTRGFWLQLGDLQRPLLMVTRRPRNIPSCWWYTGSKGSYSSLSTNFGSVFRSGKLLEIEWKKEWKEWKQGEAIAKQQIAASIPDSLFMKIHMKETACAIWVELENHFQNWSHMVSVDLRWRLQDQKCLEKGDVVAHFTTLRTMHECYIPIFAKCSFVPCSDSTPIPSPIFIIMSSVLFLS